jgi:hypothetical protein
MPLAAPAHCDFADEGGAGVASRCSPGWRGVTLAGVGLGSLWPAMAPAVRRSRPEAAVSRWRTGSAFPLWEWRRMRDSNPRGLAPNPLSNSAQSPFRALADGRLSLRADGMNAGGQPRMVATETRTETTIRDLEVSRGLASYTCTGS